MNVEMFGGAMPVGDGFTVSFRFANQQLEADWSPRMPVSPSGRKYLPAYRLARDELAVRIMRPNPPYKDFNDELMGTRS